MHIRIFYNILVAERFMMISYKKILVCLLFVQQVHAGEEQNLPVKDLKNPTFTHEINPVAPFDNSTTYINQQQLQQQNQSSILYDALSSGQVAAQSAFWNLMSMGASNVSTMGQRLYATGANYINDDCALAKLGYPSSSVNDTELKKYEAIKERFLSDIVKNVRGEFFAADAQFIGRRQGYVQRAVGMIPNRGDGLELAFFCLHNYKAVMNFFDVAILCRFIQEKQASFEHGVNNLGEQFVESGLDHSPVLMPKEPELFKSMMIGMNMSMVLQQAQQQGEEEKKEDDVSTDTEELDKRLHLKDLAKHGQG